MSVKKVQTRRALKGGKKRHNSITKIEEPYLASYPKLYEDLQNKSNLVYIGDESDYKRFKVLLDEEQIESCLGDKKDIKLLAVLDKDIVWYLDTETYPDPDQLDLGKVEADLAKEKMKGKAEGKLLTKTDTNSITKTLAGLQKEYALNPRLNKIRLVQIKSEGIVYIIDLKHNPKFGKVMKGIKERTVVMQNAKFDMSCILTHFKTEPKYVFDPMIANRMIQFVKSPAKWGSDLGSIIYRYTGIDLPKDQGGSDWSGVLNPEQILYAYYDVEYLDKIAEAQVSLLNSIPSMKHKLKGFPGLKNMLAIVEMEFTKTITKLELRGINLNKKPLLEYVESFTPKLKKLQKYFTKLDMNYMSHVQVKKYLLGKYDLELKSSDQKALTPHKKLTDVAKILEVKKLHKLSKSTLSYIEACTEDGILHPNFNTLEASTGRPSAYEPNVQTFPRQVKNFVYKALKGFEVWRYDYPGEELRIAGEVSQDPVIIEAYKTGLDIHKFFASIVFKVPYDEVTEEQRTPAKSANFGLLYGLGVAGFISQAKIKFDLDFTYEEATKLRNAFFKTYKQWKSYHDEINGILKIYGHAVLETLYGRLAYVDQFTVAVNLRVQGTGADILKISMNKIQADFEEAGLKSFMTSMVHDEIVLQIHKDETKVADKIIRKAMEKPINKVVTSFKTKIEGELVTSKPK